MQNKKLLPNKGNCFNQNLWILFLLICTILVSNLLLLSHLRLETSVTDEQLRKQVVTEEVVQAELEAQRRVLDVEHQRKMAAIREEMENEVIRRNFKGYYLITVCITIVLGVP